MVEVPILLIEQKCQIKIHLLEGEYVLIIVPINEVIYYFEAHINHYMIIMVIEQVFC